MNCVWVVIDSLNYTRACKSEEELLPFLSKCTQQGVACKNMYAQAPYTEAATMALYTGQNTLDNGGYLERYNRTEKTIFEVFETEGYEVFFNALQPQCYPSSLRRGITHIRYNRGFDHDVLWRYRLSHYSEVYKKNQLDESDYKQLYRIMEDNFIDWIQFLQDLETKDKSTELIAHLNKDYNVKEVMKLVESEYEQFSDDKKKYVCAILEKGTNHELFKIPYFSQKNYSHSSEIAGIVSKDCKRVCKKIRHRNIITNLFFNSDVYYGIWHSLWNYIKKFDLKELMNSFYLLKNAVFINLLNRRYGIKCSSLKGQPSFQAHIDNFLEWVDSKENDNPFFACIHVDDIHYPEMFFSYDSCNAELLHEELEYAEEYIHKRKIKDPGTYIHDLSLRYADKKCESLVEELKKRNLYDDTVFFFTADHGFSYSGYPIRNKPINTFYLENFKIPFYILGKRISNKIIESMASSVDIPATICDVFNIDKPPSFIGRTVFEESNEIPIIEYCGGGCPDLKRRKIMLAAFDKKRMLAANIELSKKFTWDDIVEVYNIAEDPLQKHNIVGSYNRDEYEYLYERIEQRVESIISTY